MDTSQPPDLGSTTPPAQQQRPPTWVLLAAAAALVILMAVTTSVLMPWTFEEPDLVRDQTLLRAAITFGVMILLGSAAMILAGYAVVLDMRHEQAKRRQMAQVLQTVPGIKVETSPPHFLPDLRRRILGLAARAVPLVLLLPLVPVAAVVRRLWPAMPPFAILMVAIVVLMPLFALSQRFGTAVEKGETLSLRQFVTGTLQGLMTIVVAGLVVAGLWLVLTYGQEWFGRMFDSPLAGSVVMLLLIFVGMPLVLMGVPMLAFLWVLGPIRRTDYDQALARVRTLRKTQPHSPMFLFLEASTLMYAGRWQEAETVMAQSLTEGQQTVPPAAQASALENHGFILMGQQRYDEARGAFVGSIQVRPEGSGAYSGLAEVYLRQGIEAEQALELTERALHNKAARLDTRLVDRWRWAEYHGNRAWALAMLKRHAEAEDALRTAASHAPKQFRGELAMYHFRAAQVARLRGDRAAAADHLAQARTLDPNGAAGRLAASTLEAM